MNILDKKCPKCQSPLGHYHYQAKCPECGYSEPRGTKAKIKKLKKRTRLNNPTSKGD